MRKIIIGLLIVWLNYTVAEGTPLSGLITQREMDGVPEPYVQVRAVVGEANDSKTNLDGQFVLDFPKEQPGKQVQLQCLKEGLEVVNRMDLEVVLRSDPKEEVKLIMCPKAERDACAVNYYSNILKRNFQENFDARMKQIEADYQTALQFAQTNLMLQKEALQRKYTAIAKLDEENKSLAAQAQEWAKKFAELSLENTTDEMYKEALRLFEANKLDKALAVLNDAQIEEDFQREEQQAKTKKANRYVLKARVYAAQFKFEDAETYYQKAIDTDPENINNFFEFAWYLQKQNQLSKAQLLYEKALTLTKDEGDVAIVLNNLGSVYHALNQYQDATEAYQLALNIREVLAQSNPQTYLPGVAKVLNNLGILYSDLHQYSEAMDAYQRALKIYEELAQSNPQTYLPDVAITLNNWGELYRVTNQYQETESTFQDALKIYEELAQSNPQTYLPGVAKILDNLGNLHQTLNQYSTAIDEYQRALQIREELAQTNPQAYLPDVATTLNNLGSLYIKSLDQFRILYSNFNQFRVGTIAVQHMATDALQRALTICEELAQSNPQTYLPKVAVTLNNLGMLYRRLHQYSQAMDALQRALKIFEESAQTNPQKYLTDVATTLNNLANLHFAQSDYMAALSLFKHALAIREELAKDGVGRYDFDICQTLLSLSLLYKTLSEESPQPEYKPEALEYLNRAIALMQKYPDVPQAQKYIKMAEELKTYFEGLPDPPR